MGKHSLFTSDLSDEKLALNHVMSENKVRRKTGNRQLADINLVSNM